MTYCYQGIGFPISILGNFNLIDKSTLPKKKRTNEACAIQRRLLVWFEKNIQNGKQDGGSDSHHLVVSRIIKMCNGVDERTTTNIVIIRRLVAT
jgi:hypothetical protein